MNTFTPKIMFSNSHYCLPYNSYSVSLENLVLDHPSHFWDQKVQFSLIFLPHFDDCRYLLLCRHMARASIADHFLHSHNFNV